MQDFERAAAKRHCLPEVWRRTDGLKPVHYADELSGAKAHSLFSLRISWNESRMTAEIIQFRPWREKRDIERAYEELNKQAVEIANVCFPSAFDHYEARNLEFIPNPVLTDRLMKSFIDPSQASAFHAPESDPA